MPQFAGTLIANGFDDMDTLLCIEDSDLTDLGIVSCHLVKLRRQLQEIQRRGAAATRGAEDDVEKNPVVIFLRELGLGKYSSVFLEFGFDEMETLHYMEDSDMKDLGLARGHALKLKRRLRECKATPDGAEPRAAPTPQRKFSDQVQTPSSTTSRLRSPSGAMLSDEAAASDAKQSGRAMKAPPRRAARSRLGSLPSGSTLPDEDGMTAVEQSWEVLQARGIEEMAQTFYQHLFVKSPEIIALFPMEVRLKYHDWMTDVLSSEDNVYESAALRRLFSKMLNAVGCTVAGMHDFGKLVPMLNQLGTRHGTYGVNESHMAFMRKALIQTLSDLLGNAFTQEVETAWTMVYTFMTSIMLEGLRHAQAAKEVKLPGSAWKHPLLSRCSTGASSAGTGVWVEDCRSQGSRTELAHVVTPGTAVTVMAQEVSTNGRFTKMPQLWEDDEDDDDDCHSEDSMSTSAELPPMMEACPSLQRTDTPSTASVSEEAVRPIPKSASHGLSMSSNQLVTG